MQLNMSLFEEISLLIDPEEMEEFLALIPQKWILDASQPLSTPEIKQIDFLSHYAAYVRNIQQGNLIDPGASFHGRLVVDPTIYHLKPVASNRYVVAFSRPPISMKHTTGIVASDNTLRMHVFGKERLFLGVTFQYPRLYEGEERIAKKTVGLQEFSAFRELSRFARQYSFPLKFQGQSIDVRISEKSLPWVKELPQIKDYFKSGELSWGL
ncbi:MAG: hypothetical protein ACOYK9_05825 [Chlamydiia bacterium]